MPSNAIICGFIDRKYIQADDILHMTHNGVKNQIWINLIFDLCHFSETEI